MNQVASMPFPRQGLAAGAPISVRGLSKSFGQVPVLKAVDLDIAAGEFVTLLGPSGSGKSTLLNILAGFERPDSGDIQIDGKGVISTPPHRRGFGMVFQNYALFPNMTVDRNVAFPLRMAGMSDADIDQLVKNVLELMELSVHRGKLPSALSGGQQQRVAIARAIVGDAKVILMDEPLSALDKKLREAIQLELKALHAKIGSTFIFVTHDQAEALTMSDRVAVMSDGRIEQFARPDEIYRQPVNQFVAKFIGESNLLSAEIVGSTASGVSVKTRHGTVHHVLRKTAVAQGQSVQLMVRPENVEIATDAGRPSIAATVNSIVFTGEILRIETRTEHDETLLVRAIPGRMAAIPSVGEVCQLSWSDHSAWMVS